MVSPSIQFARHHDFEGFWDQESEWRRNYDWPPCTHLILIHIRGTHQGRAQLSAETLARRLKEGMPPGATISEPAPAPLEMPVQTIQLRSLPALLRRLRGAE